MMNETITQKPDFDFDNFTFGLQATDRMLVARYENGTWSDFKIGPVQNISLSPLAMCLHYGQTVFEGLKAFRTVDGKINIFRLESHHKRMNRSLERMAMPPLPASCFIDGIRELLSKESKWVIDDPEYALYIRPFAIATESKLGVDASREYLFMVVLSPLKAYYSRPLRVKVETDYIRSSRGGAGSAKNGGNYGASLLPQRKAKENGFDQIIWLDAKERKFIEESGTMNIMFILNGKTLLTPSLSDSILDGITRDSILNIAPEMGLEVEERAIEVAEILERIRSGEKVEAFGVGTAAVISPIKEISYKDEIFETYVNENADMYRIKNKLADIRRGLSPDKFGWSDLV
ncbi:branched-chain amino acid aminotransferase [Cyclobacterium marinum]|uniref:branched-chain-amino-acid transaminase n=1 Tax=Cyclobacterium marinum (strain ATCC 25205 / DSM 745 / LMG 13164 / NCIMB 1802) TaxID=880070 RepID=G0J5I1_CYCMS|nr:branched-chain amino acid aminotransferase [Cyclobacterium marinum]AEL28430.1 branched-chain amino acid aminotransferase [Cyclobacterium marinum DSM 745]